MNRARIPWTGLQIAFLTACLAAGTARASTLVFSGLQLVSPVLQLGANNDDVVTNANVPGTNGSFYTLSVEFCESGDCSFDPSGSTAIPTIELSNLSLACTASESPCQPLDITFQGDYTATPGSPEAILFSLGVASDSGSAFTGFTRICFSDSTHICAANLTGTSSFGFNFSDSTFAGSATGTYIVGPSGPYQVLGVFHIDGLQNGGTLSIGHSLDIQTDEVGAIPEPSSGVLVASGALLLLFRKRALALIRAFRTAAPSPSPK